MVLLLALLFGIAQGCTNRNQKKEKQIAIIVSSLNNPWFVFLAQSAAEHAKRLGYQSKIFDSQNNTAIEADNFENAIASGYGAILLNPTDSEGSVANVVKAKNAGVPVFCMDREVNSTNDATSQILSDSYSGCVDMGKYFVQTIGTKGKYAELLGIVADNNTWARSKGFHSVVDYYPGLKMVAQQSADFDRNKGLEVMESILQAHPDIVAVFCGNDAMAMGAYQAVVSAGKTNQIKVFGFDGAGDAIDGISEGKISATAMQFPKVMAQTAVEYAVEYFSGKRDFPKKIQVGVELVTKENINNYSAYGKKSS